MSPLQSRRVPLEVAKCIVDGLTDSAVLLDSGLRFVTMNGAALNSLGLRPRELMRKLTSGEKPLELFGNVDAQETAKRAMSDGRPIRLHEVPFTLANGEQSTAIVGFTPISGTRPGSCAGLIFTFRDVTAEARMQRRYTHLLRRERARADDLARQVEDRTRELEVALREVTRLAHTDSLTGALSRRAFTELAKQALSVAGRHGRSVGILLCDLDYFKEVNDTFGHQAGDTVLKATVEALSKSIRESDRIARFGGEEFVILLSETAQDNIAEVGERCRRAVEGIPLHELVPGAVRKQTVSVGCALFPTHGKTTDELLAAADRALYYAKERGRNRVETYSPQLRDSSWRRRSTESDAARLLLVHPEGEDRVRCQQLLASTYRTIVEHSVAAGVDRIRNERIDIIVAKADLPDGSGIDLLEESRAYHPNAVRVLLTDRRDFSIAARGVSHARADHVLLASEVTQRLRDAVEESLEWRKVLRRRVLSHGPASRMPGPRVERLELDAAIQRDALDAHYQPIIRLDSRKVIGFEALCRPKDGLLSSPQLLIDASLAAGRIWDLGRMMRRVIGEQLSALPPEGVIFVNLHPADLDDPELLSGEALLRGSASRIVLEITERSWIPDFRRCKESVHRLRTLGYRIAVDDLGSGYASLNSVALLEPHFVKIDKALVRHIEDHAHAAKLVRRIVEFANDAGSEVVAEGVETEVEAQMVADLGCHLAQGYFFGRPVPSSELGETASPVFLPS